MKLLQAAILGAFILALSACGGGSSQGPANPIPTMTGEFDPSKEAFVLFKANKKRDSGKLGFVKVYIQKEGTSQIQYYICLAKDNMPIGERLAPGRYVFVLVSGDILATPVEPVPVVTFDPEKNIPLTPIEVKAGEVLYLGNILIEGIGERSARGRADGIKYTVEDHSDLAKQVLANYRPELVSRLQTRLIQVLP